MHRQFKRIFGTTQAIKIAVNEVRLEISMSLHIWARREGPGRALPVSEFGKKGTVSGKFSKPAPSMLSKRTCFVVPLFAQLNWKAACASRVCYIEEKLESSEEMIRQFYYLFFCFVFIFNTESGKGYSNAQYVPASSALQTMLCIW